jgi:acetolactate synthase-1/2/3 large subunit
MTRTRIGGDLVAETLRALGADTVFGLPGQHALGLFEALRHAPGLRVISGRVENNLAFAADGFARARLTANPHGRVPVTPMIVSTAPRAAHSGVAARVAGRVGAGARHLSQVPVAGLGGGRHGFLHELPDQRASFRDVVESVHQVRAASQITGALRAAWQSASTVPFGPSWVEIPRDVLLAQASLPPIHSIRAPSEPLLPLPELVDEAAGLLATARSPVILAGGGVLRGGAGAEPRRLAEALRAPVLCTFGGKGAFGWDHPLSGQSWLEDRHSTEFLADVRFVLPALTQRLPRRNPDGRAETAVRGLLSRVRQRLDEQGLAGERKLLADVRSALPEGTPAYWDMTILGYWAWSAWNPDGAAMHSAQGAGGLGYGLPDVRHRRTGHRRAARAERDLADRGRRRLRHPARVPDRRVRFVHRHRAGPAGLRLACPLLRGIRRFVQFGRCSDGPGGCLAHAGACRCGPTHRATDVRADPQLNELC